MKGVAVGVIVGGASILLLQVEVTQADRQAGVIGFTPQRGGAHCCEGAWTQAVRRNNLTVWKGRKEKGKWDLDRERRVVNSGLTLCFALISHLPKLNPDCEHIVLKGLNLQLV